MPYRKMRLGPKLFVSVLAGLLWMPAVRAQTPPKPAHVAAARPYQSMAIGFKTPPFLFLLRSARLTPEQRQQVRQILRSHAAQNRMRFARLRRLRGEIADKLLGSAPVSASDLVPLERQVVQTEQQVRLNMINSALAIRKVLTPGQLSRVSELHQQLTHLRARFEALLGQQAH